MNNDDKPVCVLRLPITHGIIRLHWQLPVPQAQWDEFCAAMRDTTALAERYGHARQSEASGLAAPPAEGAPSEPRP